MLGGIRMRDGAPECEILAVQSNLANTYSWLGRDEEALSMRREVYSRTLKLFGEEHSQTLIEANNYASLLKNLKCFEETNLLLRKTIPVTRRILGKGHRLTLKMRWIYAQSLYEDNGATLDSVREAVTTLEDLERIAQRVFGGMHPITEGIEGDLRDARAILRARETPSPGSA
jgi:hypothetical protein